MNENNTTPQQTDAVKVAMPRHAWEEVTAGLTIARDHCRQHGDHEAAKEAEGLALEIAKQTDPARFAAAALLATLARAARR